jgi:putative transposase
MLKVVHDSADPNSTASVLDEIVRDGARQMLAAALQAEVAAFIEAHRGEVDDQGRRLVVRNGYHQPREVTTAAGVVEVRQPWVNDKRVAEGGGGVAAAVSTRLSSSDFGPALEQFLGSDQGLSAATITRLTTQWQDEARVFNTRSLAGSDYVYVWVDGIHLKVRLEQDKVCLLVIIGVRADGRKELVALADGFRESAESWADSLRDAKRRGMQVLAVGDGALGFWKAVRDVFPETTEQRCWWHKIGNILAALPKSAHRPPRRPWPRSTTPRTRPTPAPPPRRSPPSSAPNGPRRPRRSATTSTCCSPCTTTRPTTGSTCAPPTRSSPPSPPSG